MKGNFCASSTYKRQVHPQTFIGGFFYAARGMFSTEACLGVRKTLFNSLLVSPRIYFGGLLKRSSFSSLRGLSPTLSKVDGFRPWQSLPNNQLSIPVLSAVEGINQNAPKFECNSSLRHHPF